MLLNTAPSGRKLHQHHTCGWATRVPLRPLVGAAFAYGNDNYHTIN